MEKVIPLILACLLSVTPTLTLAETSTVSLEQAQGTRLATAIGHYARARSLLIAAIREFDKGRAKADPASLLDTDAWRDTLRDRVSDLDRVLAPQPRATRDGVAFDPDSRLIGSGPAE
jgi:hypothetical protein